MTLSLIARKSIPSDFFVWGMLPDPSFCSYVESQKIASIRVYAHLVDLKTRSSLRDRSTVNPNDVV